MLYPSELRGPRTIIAGLNSARNSPAPVFPPRTVDETGCPTLGAPLFLRPGWDCGWLSKERFLLRPPTPEFRSDGAPTPLVLWTLTASEKPAERALDASPGRKPGESWYQATPAPAGA